MNGDGARRLAVTSNNVYHDWEMTKGLARIAAQAADTLGRNIAFVGVGGLSGSIFRDEIEIEGDKIATDDDDAWNRKILDLMTQGDVSALVEVCPQYAEQARVDMGFKPSRFHPGWRGRAVQTRNRPWLRSTLWCRRRRSGISFVNRNPDRGLRCRLPQR